MKLIEEDRFIFGGTTGEVPDSSTSTDLATVYILTLPAFHWVKTSAVAPTWRADQTCSVIGNRQMISIGGVRDPGSGLIETVVPPPPFDPWTNGMQILDMSDLSWTEDYNPSAAPYQSPDVIAAFYDSNDRYPASWVDSGLQAIFQQNRSRSTSTPSGSSPSTTLPSDTLSGSQGVNKNGKSHANVIAGGVVGGIVLLCIVAGLAFWYMRRKRNRHLPDSLPSMEHLTTGKGEPLELHVREDPQELGQEYLRHELGSSRMSGSSPYEIGG